MLFLHRLRVLRRITHLLLIQRNPTRGALTFDVSCTTLGGDAALRTAGLPS